ncbi:MAG: hypothetical protein OXP12_06525 [Thaumarchaeota archaeon]|nr:hypothetical protein [Nitrososphaerota archaeon]
MTFWIANYCTLYTDGSGGHGWVKPVGKDPNRFHTLAGLIIDPESDLLAKDRVNKVLNSYIPEEAKNIRPNKEYELHFDAIKSARGIYRKIDKKERDEIIYVSVNLVPRFLPFT